MRAIVHDHYGPPSSLVLRELAEPRPAAGEVLVRVRAIGVNAADWHVVRADPWVARLALGLRRPRLQLLGQDVAGVVEAVGPDASRFQAGDAVFGNLFGTGRSGFAELVAVPEAALLPRPERVSWEEAAATPLAAITAHRALFESGGLRAGQRVLVNGAAGGVGTFAVQLARHAGAHVTAVCSARNAEQAARLGAQRVLDYAREDFTTEGERYDVILGVNGYHPLAAYRRALAPCGTYVMVGGTGKQMAEGVLLAPLRSRGDRRLTRVDTAPAAGSRAARERGVARNREALAAVAALLDAGELVAVVEATYPLERAGAAIEHVEAGHARGKIVVVP